MGVPSPLIQTQGVGHLLGHLQIFLIFFGGNGETKKIPTIFWVTQQMSHPSCWNGLILGGIVLPGTNSNPN
jgi:hypothetical protein